MKNALLFATVLALAIVALNIWTSREVGFPEVELNVQLKFSLHEKQDLRNES